MMRTDEPRGAKGYCLFPCGAGSLAVGVDAVEAVMEADRLVRLPLCPRPVFALCIYRGSILPIVGPVGDSKGWDGARGGRLPAVLVLRTGHGHLGLLIDRGALAVVEDCQVSGGDRRENAGGEAWPLPEGLVAAGSIERDGLPHPVLDVDRTWKAMRSLIESGYDAGRGNGPLAASTWAAGGIGDDSGSFDEGG